jgi:hypothetical protein
MSYTERPVLVEYLQYEDLYTYVDDGVPIERKPLRPGEVWVDYNSIPAVPPAPSPFPATAGVLTTGILDEPLVPVPGSTLQFTTAPSSRLLLVLPGNIQGRAYRPTLKDANSRIIAYNPSVWIVDGSQSVVAFKYSTPTALGFQLPLSLTYWVYTGAIVGAAGIVTVTNEGGGAEVYDTANSTAVNAVLRTLVAGTAATVTQNATTVTVASNPGFYTRTVVAVAVYAVLSTDDILAVTGTMTTNVTLNLPQIAALGGPKRYSIVDEGGRAFVHPITVVAFAGDTIIGATSVQISNNYNSINIYHNGATGWFIA